MFADKYLKKNNNQPLITKLPDPNTRVIVVIPCLFEPDIASTLNSLKKCTFAGFKAEVIVLINHSETADSATRLRNKQTRVEIDDWIVENDNFDISFFAVGPVELRKKWAGVGLARKKGMDEAVRRFNMLRKKNGIIVSLDADTIVSTNYFEEIDGHFKNNPKHIGATISFQHRKDNLPKKQKEGIGLYELYLSYYKRALAYAGYPYALFSVGSAFAVTASAYVKRGGMNRRQAGEDFYFLQNLVHMGPVGEIQSTKVYPSARLSNRVPFGTGPVLKKWMEGKEDLTKTYNLDAFIDLKKLFDIKNNFYKIGKSDLIAIMGKLPKPVSDFIEEDNFIDELNELNKNCSGQKIFETRFFQIFNAFKILKYLNSTHEKYYLKADIKKQCRRLNDINLKLF